MGSTYDNINLALDRGRLIDDLPDKLDTLYLAGRLTKEEYEELMQRISAAE